MQSMAVSVRAGDYLPVKDALNLRYVLSETVSLHQIC
jgi:hypothetical protein